MSFGDNSVVPNQMSLEPVAEMSDMKVGQSQPRRKTVKFHEVDRNNYVEGED